jgi:hypothetical protein
MATKLSPEHISRLRIAINAFVKDWVKQDTLESGAPWSLDDIACSMIQAAATVIPALDGDKEQNVEWALRNFVQGLVDLRMIRDANVDRQAVHH